MILIKLTAAERSHKGGYADMQGFIQA